MPEKTAAELRVDDLVHTTHGWAAVEVNDDRGPERELILRNLRTDALLFVVAPPRNPPRQPPRIKRHHRQHRPRAKTP